MWERMMWKRQEGLSSFQGIKPLSRDLYWLRVTEEKRTSRYYSHFRPWEHRVPSKVWRAERSGWGEASG